MAKISTYTKVNISNIEDTDYVLGTGNSTTGTPTNETKNFPISVLREYLNYNTVPPATASPGLPGQFATNGAYLYICVAANSWRRVLLSTFP
tara:strand:- start:8698 stop:8973 length:276 start_codon:yes stop_codon:yes gene_type:complete